MVIQHTITAYGLTKQDQATLMSFLKVLNLGETSPWVYSGEETAEVVLVDLDHDEGKKFVWAYQIGVHDGKRMVSVGENTSGCQGVHCLGKPLRCNNLREIFDDLIDAEGCLVGSDNYHADEDLLVCINA